MTFSAYVALVLITGAIAHSIYLTIENKYRDRHLTPRWSAIVSVITSVAWLVILVTGGFFNGVH